jgi:hypothetical protein
MAIDQPKQLQFGQSVPAAGGRGWSGAEISVAQMTHSPPSRQLRARCAIGGPVNRRSNSPVTYLVGWGWPSIVLSANIFPPIFMDNAVYP